jgi:hypothetical protein
VEIKPGTCASTNISCSRNVTQPSFFVVCSAVCFLKHSTVQPTVGNEVITNPADIVPFHVVGNEGGSFPSAVETSQVLLGPAERYDIVIDFSTLPAGEWRGLPAVQAKFDFCILLRILARQSCLGTAGTC